MKPSASKNRELIVQNPFLETILGFAFEPGNGRRIDSLTIKIQKADGDLMWRQADNIGIGEDSWIASTQGHRKGQLARRGECVFAVGRDNTILQRLDYPRNDKEAKTTGEVYAMHVLWAGRERGADGSTIFTNSLCGDTKYMVWVSVENWHEDTGVTNSPVPGVRFGKLCERCYTITIYGEPEGGFEKLLERSPRMNHLYLDSRVLMRGYFRRDTDVIAIEGRLAELCTLFQDDVYFNGMREVFERGGKRGASGQFESVKVLCAEMCGYHRIMLEDANCWVSYQLRPESKWMYVLGMGGTLPNIRRITKTVVKMWNGDPKNREAFKPDAEVSVM